VLGRYPNQVHLWFAFPLNKVWRYAAYDGKGPWLDYKSHFDACSQINHWSDKERGLYLAVSLRGQAQGVLGNLPLESRQDFKELVKSACYLRGSIS
jgi:hypothetical protein